MINNINIYKQDDLNAMITAAFILDKEKVLSAFLYCLCRAAPRCIASWYYNHNHQRQLVVCSEPVRLGYRLGPQRAFENKSPSRTTFTGCPYIRDLFYTFYYWLTRKRVYVLL